MHGRRMTRPQSLWLALRSSLWFVPTLMVLAAMSLALVLVEIEPLVQGDLAARWPRLFGAGAEGSRGMLSAIATTMVTVAGVVFSVTIVALSLASTQYSPRVLRHFMSDRPTQVVLGAFVSVFAYCLVVLRTIRGGEGEEFVPSIAVLGGVVLALVGIGLLIFFIHHVASSIQASAIIERITEDTRVAIDRLFPSDVGGDAGSGGPPATDVAPSAGGCQVAADRSGYVLAVQAERLLDMAARHDAVIHVLPRVGQFVAEGQPLLQMHGAAMPCAPEAAALRGCIALGPERDVHQDAPHGLQQLVDVGLRALSPSLHDPTTALACIDRLFALLLRLTGRRIPAPFRLRDGRVRLVVAGPTYEEMVETAFGALTHHAGPHVEVHRRLVQVVAQLAGATQDPQRLAILRTRLRAHEARLSSAGLAASDEARLRASIEALMG